MKNIINDFLYIFYAGKKEFSDMESIHDDSNIALPTEMFEHLISLCCLTQVLNLSDINTTFKSLVVREVLRRLKRMNDVSVKKGFPVDIFPICFFLTDFHSKDCKIAVRENKLKISGTALILKFIRLFGDKMKYIVLSFSGSSEEQANTVFSSVNKNCYNLEILAFGCLDYDLERSLVKPFVKATTVFFQYSRIHNKLCDLNKYFPSLKDLTFSETNFFQSFNQILCRYVHLEKLEICVNSMNLVDAVFLQILNPTTEVIYYGENLDDIVNDDDFDFGFV